MRRGRIRRPWAAALMLPLLWGADAQAGTLSVVPDPGGPVVRYADAGAEANDVDILYFDASGVLLTDAPGLAEPGDGCEFVQILGRSAARCQVAGAARLDLDLGAGADAARVTSTERRVVFLGGEGNDRFDAHAGEVRVASEAHGGPGNDVLWGGSGPDAQHGDAGDDLLYGGHAPDDADAYDGGDGTDTVSYTFRGWPVAADLDGQADDGTPGEGDRIGADVEVLIGGAQDDVLTGDDGPNTLDGGHGSDTLDPRGGADVVLAGPSLMKGGEDDDTITVRDGAADTVACGLGADTTSADTRDVLDADCEPGRTTVADPPPPSSSSSGSPPATTTTSTVPSQRSDPAPATTPSIAALPVPVPVTVPLRRPAPPSVRSSLSGGFVLGARTRIQRLEVVRVERGTTVVVLCRGGGCPFARRSVRSAPARPRLSLTALLRRARLRSGAVLEVRMTRPGATGRVEVLTIRARRLPARRVLCLPPGAVRPAAC